MGDHFITNKRLPSKPDWGDLEHSMCKHRKMFLLMPSSDSKVVLTESLIVSLGNN